MEVFDYETAFLVYNFRKHVSVISSKYNHIEEKNPAKGHPCRNDFRAKTVTEMSTEGTRSPHFGFSIEETTVASLYKNSILSTSFIRRALPVKFKRYKHKVVL